MPSINEVNIKVDDLYNVENRVIENYEDEHNQEEELAITVPLIKRKPPHTQWKDSILVKTLSFGLNGLFFSAYIVSNGKLLAMLGDQGSGAGALASPYQSVLLGTSVGFLLSTGFEMGPHIGKKKYHKAGNIAKTAWVLAATLGTLSSAAMLSSRFIFPLLFESQTAQTALDFFTGCSIGNIPMLLLVANMQIAFQEGDWFIPPLAGFLLFGSAVTASYLLGFSAGLGAFGIGLGGAVAQWLLALGSQAWFLRSSYEKYGFHQMTAIPGFSKKMKSLLSSGWKLSLQRLTEWGNLMLITTLIGIKSNNALKATSPSAQYIGIIAASLQGIGQAAGMLISRNIGSRDKAIKLHDEAEARKYHQKNIQTLFLNNIAAAVINGGIAASFYFLRKPLSRFFLASEADYETAELAETLLWINMIGLIPDAVRIVSSGALRGWKDIVYSTMISLFMMIAIGVPSGFGLAKAFPSDQDDDGISAWMFYARDVAMLIAALMIVNRCRKRASTDTIALSASFPDRNPTAEIDYSQHSVNLSQKGPYKQASYGALPSIKGNKSLLFQPATTRNSSIQQKDMIKDMIDEEEIENEAPSYAEFFE